MTQSTDVAVVVVTHDTCDELLECLSSLADAAEIVVVETGRGRACLEDVVRRFPDVIPLQLANVGYGRAANAGVARTTTGTVVVCNADTRFSPGALATLQRALDDAPGLAAVGPRVRYPDGRDQASARRFPSVPVAVGHALTVFMWPSNPWTRRYRPNPAALAPGPVDWLSGCALAVRREAFDDVGGFDPAYFMFVEDVDLAWRLRQRGWEVAFEPAAEVVHRVGASTSQRSGTLAFAHARSLHRFWVRAYGRGPNRMLQPLVALGLAGWAVVAWAWQRFLAPRSGRSTTGE